MPRKASVSQEDKRRQQLEAGIKPLWVLMPRGRPSMVSSTNRAHLADATHYCREGDRAWRPIAELFQKNQSN
ncbi:MAG TPA: hypothetical protein VH092_20300 [Urbifossiella sp.]|jgi:hypothetical protein|nr:hypothetical protein [Urbifossiella sp.]